MARPKIDIKEKDLKNYYNLGWTTQQIAQHYKCSSATILRRCKQYNIDVSYLCGNYLRDLTNECFGLLVVIKKSGNKDKDGRSRWICKCDCGNIVEKSSKHLLDGNTKSCGCLTSFGEANIQKVLKEFNIPYIHQYSNSNLRTEQKGNYKFDFALLDKNNKVYAVIEYHGKQHYEEQGRFFFYTHEDFEKLHKRDLEKEEYCKDNGILYFVIDFNYNTLDKVRTKIKSLLRL